MFSDSFLIFLLFIHASELCHDVASTNGFHYPLEPYDLQHTLSKPAAAYDVRYRHTSREQYARKVAEVQPFTGGVSEASTSFFDRFSGNGSWLQRGNEKELIPTRRMLGHRC